MMYNIDVGLYSVTWAVYMVNRWFIELIEREKLKKRRLNELFQYHCHGRKSRNSVTSGKLRRSAESEKWKAPSVPSAVRRIK